jgi:hypothetical protein
MHPETKLVCAAVLISAVAACVAKFPTAIWKTALVLTGAAKLPTAQTASRLVQYATPAGADWTFVLVIILVIVLVMVGCICGVVGAMIGMKTRRAEQRDRLRSSRSLTQQRAQPASLRRRTTRPSSTDPVVTTLCSHTDTTENGKNQWKFRVSCKACGAVLRSEDTPLNIERKRLLRESLTPPPVETAVGTPVAGPVSDSDDDDL